MVMFLYRPAVYMKDLESAIHYSLRQEVAICQTIKGEELSALKLYITALVKVNVCLVNLRNRNKCAAGIGILFDALCSFL